MSVLVLKGGLLSTIQDKGRYGYQHKGVSPCGAMDLKSLRLANVLLNNHEFHPCIETCHVGVTLKFLEKMDVAITGGEFPLLINGEEAPMYQTLHMIEGDILEIGYARKGVYAYIAFSKSLILPKILGSYSTDSSSGIGGLQGRKLIKGDVLNFHQKEMNGRLNRSAESIDLALPEEITRIRILEGREYNHFDQKEQEKFLRFPFTISDMCDRMGYRLTNNPIKALRGNDILSEGLTLGTIQATASGDIIVMLADRQPTGGYTRIANIISVDLSKFVQLRAGSQVQFERVTLDEAHRLLEEEEDLFKEWKRNLPVRDKIEIKNNKRMSIKINKKLFNVGIEEVMTNEE